MSLSKDILELREKRGNLETERRSLTEEKRKKIERLRALEQMMIVELSNGNDKMRQDLSQLDSKIGDLENRLEQVRQEAENQNDELSQANVQINAVLVSADTISESSVPPSENKDRTTSQGSEKKKRTL
jgi:FtsZ-binding cell division protein ZapB